ncbi:hypothetical protein ISN44_As01g002830 [Arabidopsis suecica]|uniref:Uncharacterized protein n=1 Tax=Arabidopsis suecica TaxID=45249 RepID=A0A8T2H0M4_ARASU|nr:hypothetical protein ISN44_As01g002830 [Arabidopsis suecica]
MLMANVTRKSSLAPEIQEMPPSANLLGSNDQLPTSTSPTLPQHILKKIPNPTVPAIRDVEQPPNDPTEKVLNFVTRAHEFLRWAIASVILFVPIQYLIEAQKKEDKKPDGGFSPHQLISIIKASIIKFLFGFDIYLAYPFCGLLVAYGTFHLAASYVSSPTLARKLEWLSLGSGFLALGAVIYFIGPWVFIGSLISAAVILGCLGIRWCILRWCREEKKDVEAAILV